MRTSYIESGSTVPWKKEVYKLLCSDMSLNNILYFYSISSSVVILVTTMDTEPITGMVCAFQLELFCH